MAVAADLLLEEGALLALVLVLVEGPPVPAPTEVVVAQAAGRRALAAPAGAAALRSVRRPSEIVRVEFSTQTDFGGGLGGPGCGLINKASGGKPLLLRRL